MLSASATVIAAAAWSRRPALFCGGNEAGDGLVYVIESDTRSTAPA